MHFPLFRTGLGSTLVFSIRDQRILVMTPSGFYVLPFGLANASVQGSNDVLIFLWPLMECRSFWKLVEILHGFHHFYTHKKTEKTETFLEKNKICLLTLLARNNESEWYRVWKIQLFRFPDLRLVSTIAVLIKEPWPIKCKNRGEQTKENWFDRSSCVGQWGNIH